MSKATSIRDVVFDFDGTCTQIPGAYEKYLDIYRQVLCEQVPRLTSDLWLEAQQKVRAHSPLAGWMAGGTPAAPAAADPYILADETKRHLVRTKKLTEPLPADAHHRAYDAAPAAWREEARDVFETLVVKWDVRIHFVSNSSGEMIQRRLQELFPAGSPVWKGLSVESDAAKFRIQELTWDGAQAPDAELQAAFLKLPATSNEEELNRPQYVRRGSYFEAICRAIRNDPKALRSTLCCGDIWEMDLLMPSLLDVRVHLLERSAPFETYRYELQAVDRLGDNGRVSSDLTGIYRWFD